MEEYTRDFLCAKLYQIINADSESDIPFYNFCEKWLPKDYDGHEKAWEELLDVFQQAEQNAFSVGFKTAIILTK